MPEKTKEQEARAAVWRPSALKAMVTILISTAVLAAASVLDVKNGEVPPALFAAGIAADLIWKYTHEGIPHFRYAVMFALIMFVLIVVIDLLLYRTGAVIGGADALALSLSASCVEDAAMIVFITALILDIPFLIYRRKKKGALPFIPFIAAGHIIVCAAGLAGVM